MKLEILKKLLTFSIILCAIAGFAPAVLANEALSLIDCYHLALKQSESVAIQREVLKEAEGRFGQSFSTILPQVEFVYSNEYQQGRGSDSISGARFTLSQPLFSGFKEFAAIAASKSEKRQRREEIEHAKELLFMDVAEAFYLNLLYTDDLATLNLIQKALSDRTDDLTKRRELGRTRASEVASAQARLKRIEADIALVESQKIISHQLLEFLIGQKFDALKDEPESSFSYSLSLDEFLKKTETRHDVLAAKEAWNVAQKNITVARSGVWPAVSLDGNYYTKRTGSSSDIDWDATLNVTAPVFQGGENRGKIKEARAQSEEARLLYQETKRRADLDIQNAYTTFQAQTKQTQLLEEAQAAAEKNYQLQSEDYRLSLVNNLEVLQALEDWQNARRDFTSAASLMRRAYWQLKTSIGEIPE